MHPCRICGSEDVRIIVDLGIQALSGVFPRSRNDPIDRGPLQVAKCRACGLAQLTYSYPTESLYGQNYGYRSGLNASMIHHLNSLTSRLERLTNLKQGDVVVDIGANDGTLLRSYSATGILKVAVDPTIVKYRDFYSDDENTTLVPELFSEGSFWSFAPKKAKIVTSIAMFYDLEDPIQFARDVEAVLDDSGVWMLEQSYAPWMVRSGAYDTICHEHLEYYSLHDIRGILEQAGLQILDVTTNQVNGGSFNVIASKSGDSRQQSVVVDWLLRRELESGFNTTASWFNFAAGVERHVAEFTRLLTTLRTRGHTIKALGASTKGNVILQACAITEDIVSEIGEVNSDKFGCYTPGTGIPIVPEDEVIGSAPDFLVILPWHFRDGFVRRLREFLAVGGRLILPLPDIEIVGN